MAEMGVGGSAFPSEHVTQRTSMRWGQEEKQLAQSRPANAAGPPTSIYSPRTGVFGVITELLVCNNTAGAVGFRLFHDADGTTYDTTTALYYGKSVPANDTFEKSFGSGNGAGLTVVSGGNVAFQTLTDDALSITLYGYEVVIGQ